MFKKLFICLFMMLTTVEAKSQIIILDCNFKDAPGTIFNFHIDPIKQKWIQFNTSKYEIPQAALTQKSKFNLVAELFLSSKEIKDLQIKYNDGAIYSVRMVFVDINRYSGALEMFTYTMDKNNFDVYLTKLKSLKESKNIYLDMKNFARSRNIPGSKFSLVGNGVCIKSNKKF